MAFKSLPPEIMQEIFCNVDSERLLDLTTVCKSWNDTIKKLLTIQTHEVPDPRFNDAVNIFEMWERYSNGYYSFTVHRAEFSIRNIISKRVVNKVTGDYLYSLEETEYTNIFQQLSSRATHGGAYSDSRCRDVKGSVWRTLAGLIGLKRSIEKLQGKSAEDEDVKLFMTKYRWYTYKSNRMAGIAWDVGVIALYPDNQTFSVLMGSDYD
jgi:hypothetical protein